MIGASLAATATIESIDQKSAPARAFPPAMYRHKKMRLNRSITALMILLATGGMLASTAYTRDAARVVSYACPSGEQFTVEYLRNHVRLRTGAGVFALAHESSTAGERYSNGQTVFVAAGKHAQLQQAGQWRHTDCSVR